MAAWVKKEVIGDAILYLGDCLEIMPMLGKVDAVVTDPPYGIDFMGKEWDHGIPGERFWRTALDISKPGAHLLAFGGTRTFHRLVCAIEDAGWEIRDTIMWVYGSGFPKSLDVSKAIDKAAGVEREVVGRRTDRAATPKRDFRGGAFHAAAEHKNIDCSAITVPATEAAKQWDGWGTALKPAWEPIILARKPFTGTVAANVLEHGTGGLNIEACRAKGILEGNPHRFDKAYSQGDGHQGWKRKAHDNYEKPIVRKEGRFPANLIHDGSEEVMRLFPSSKDGVAVGGYRTASSIYGTVLSRKADAPDMGYGGEGSTARFFYCAKASKQDRDEGLWGLNEELCGMMEDDNYPIKTGNGNLRETKRRNTHPTVKPTDLMRYLCRLITPPGGIILDPFMGSGSTGKAAILEGFRFVGVEIEEESFDIACRRIDQPQRQGQLFQP